jgi:hypothetical protein
VAPLKLEKYPAEHLVHETLAESSENVPARQSTQFEAPEAENDPAGHASHSTEPFKVEV